MSIHDVLEMSRSRVSDDLIISQIRSSGSRFELTPTDVTALHNEGVNDRVIQVMMDTKFIRGRPVVVGDPVYGPGPDVVIVTPPPPPPHFSVGLGYTFMRPCRRW
jgi:hypothetical protein